MRYWLSILLLPIGLFSVYSQTLIGKIIDTSGQPISNAYVFINTGQQAKLTNELGQFSFEKVQATDSLQIQYLGFEPKIYRIEDKDSKQPIVIILEEAVFDLSQAVVSNSTQSLKQIAAIDLKTTPVRSSQEILRKVPGLFIGQHAGGGKAEQIFLRGFDIDHGTDINISVDGIPVNMVSHAHGQGYSDLHFLIPETVERIDFGKGPYYADKGNFTTAGYVNFQTKDRLEHSSIGLEIGRFNTRRAVGLLQLLEGKENQSAYFATEFIQTDGPVESPQDFVRWNGMGKYTIQLPHNDRLSILASHFTSSWNASGQIPQRLVEAGSISRFGSVDDTEGGTTSRSNLAIDYTKTWGHRTFLKNNFYYSRYDFELFSNFTFFLNDPENGDQIKQAENRHLFGGESVLHYEASTTTNLKAGIGFRQDNVNNNELSHTRNRTETLIAIQYGNVNESNIYGFIDAEWVLGKVRINPSLRVDHFQQQYYNALIEKRLPTNKRSLLAPHLNILYTPNNSWQLYVKSGIGFHSNDTRVIAASIASEILPKAHGIDVGTIWKPNNKTWIQAAWWFLHLEQEFVYVGDEGIVEPSGQTRRLGIDLSLRYQLHKNLFFDSDINYTYARSIDESAGNDFIPLAPSFTSSGGLSWKHPKGITSSLRYRYLQDRAANEDNSIVATGYFLTDLAVTYDWSNLSFGIQADNLFNTEWNEAQFATTSRLRGETQGVEEIHFTPGTPFFLKGIIKYRF